MQRRWLFALLAIFAILSQHAFVPVASQELTEEEEVSEEELEQLYSFEILLGMVFIFIMLLVAYFIHETPKLHVLPESGAIIVVGMIIGLIIHFSGNTLSDVITFDPKLFFLVLLPPIIFDAGYSLQKTKFFGQIGGILVYAVIGTTVSTIIVGCFIFLVGRDIGGMRLSYDLPLVDSFMFGALISATDPVATLAIFSAMNVNPQLHMLVFGESVLNDAVAIVLYRTVAVFKEPGNSLTVASTVAAFGQFILISIGSIVIGVAVAMLGSIFFKYAHFKKYPNFEFAFMLMLAYTPYLLADGLSLSGIMAVLFCGLIMSHYTQFNISTKSRHTCQVVFNTVAFVSESFVFIFLGMSVFAFKQVISVPMWCWALLFCLIGRACNIFPLTALLNRFRRKDDVIVARNQVIMWFSGLRGAIAFSLAVNFPGEHGPVIVTTTLALVLFTCLLLGGTTLPMLNLLKVQRAGEVQMSRGAEAEQLDEARHSIEFKLNPLTMFEQIDKVYMKPFFRITEAAMQDAENTATEAAVAEQPYGHMQEETTRQSTEMQELPPSEEKV